ncbi:hypothetical protein CW368_07790 [Actinomycetales bacterium SN12]|nr:hypothetical protein CW368_07790 [Actinomycetales bacterium SN12]
MLAEVGRLGSMFAVSESLKGIVAPIRVPTYLFEPALESAISTSLQASSLLGHQDFKGILGSVPIPSFLSDETTKSIISRALELSTLSTGAAEMLRGTSMLDPKIPGLTGVGFPASLFAPMQSIINEQLTSLTGFTGLSSSLLGDLSWIGDLTKGLQLGKPHLPSNWRRVETEPDDLEDEVRVILEEGIPLAWVPSARVIELLLAAPDASSRRRVISNNHKGILTGCERLVSRLPQKRALLYGDMIRKAVNALRDEHVEAAQSLATNVLDTLLTQHSKDALDVPIGVVTNAASYKKFRKQSWRLTLAVHPATTVMSGRYGVDDRPSGYRRNATAHAITRHQYNRINAVLAVMNATSVLTCFVRDTPAFD